MQLKVSLFSKEQVRKLEVLPRKLIEMRFHENLKTMKQNRMLRHLQEEKSSTRVSAENKFNIKN